MLVWEGEGLIICLNLMVKEHLPANSQSQMAKSKAMGGKVALF